MVGNIEDTSECNSFKNISSFRETCNLEDVLYDLHYCFQCFLKKKVSLYTNRLLAVDGKEDRATSGTVYITVSSEG